MTAVEASTGRLRTMADGTVRLEVDFEPRHAQDAFKLFASPGTRVALAALKPDATPAEPPAAQPAKRTIGPICQWLVFRCKEPEFQEWLKVEGESAAAQEVRTFCRVASRAEIDGNERAERVFNTGIRGPYSKWLLARGKATT